MAEDYYTQYCREHTDTEARAFLIDQLRKADAAIASLEREVETLKAGMSKKDEALRDLIDTVDAELSAGKADGCTTVFGCEVKQGIMYAEEALSLTPASVAEEAAHAKVGRAAIALRDQWRDRIKSDQPTTGKEEAMWRELVRAIGDALHEAGEIAKAREGGKE